MSKDKVYSNDEIQPKSLKPIYWLRNYLSENYINQNTRFLGQVLTIIDASISDKEQRKGIKDLIQADYYRTNTADQRMREIIFDYCQKYCPNTLPQTSDDQNVFLRQVPENPSAGEAVHWTFEK